MFKKIIISMMVLIILVSSLTPIAAAAETYQYCYIIKFTVGSKTAYVNNEPRQMNTISAPYIQSGMIIAPLRFVSESLGCWVTWDRFMKGRTDVETGDGTIVEFLAGDKNIYVGDLSKRKDSHANAGWTKRVMKQAPVIKKDDRMYVPVKDLADAINAELSYDPQTKSVTIKRVDTKDWKEYTEPYTQTKIKYPPDWDIETRAKTLKLYKNGTTFKFFFDNKKPQDLIKAEKEKLMRQGWKLSEESPGFIKMTREYQGDNLVHVIKTREIPGGCLIFDVENQSWVPEWNLRIIGKITASSGI